MNLRGALSDKQKLINALEEAYKRATSERDFYTRIEKGGFEIYYRRGKEAGVVLKRRFRFRTLGYSREILKDLSKNLSKVKRLETISRIREQQRERKRSRER